MNIREATASDIPHIVSLLKMSLGESLMPKSAAFWQWKHADNPFGPSPVLVATEGDELIGVRAFMRWQWSLDGQMITAVRAVDTATHPGHQGKGIFKKLTLQLVDQCREGGTGFIFNTPNSQSKPGYLKMGWQEAGRLPVNFALRRPLSMALHAAKLRKTEPGPLQPVTTWLQHPGLPALLKETSKTTIHTAYSVPYLRWRYQDVPVASYGAVGLERSGSLHGLAIYRFKSSRMGVELRLCEAFASSRADFDALVKTVRKSAGAYDYLTVSGVQPWRAGLISKAGPTVTVNNLNFMSAGYLMQFQQWSPALGDLELF